MLSMLLSCGESAVEGTDLLPEFQMRPAAAACCKTSAPAGTLSPKIKAAKRIISDVVLVISPLATIRVTLLFSDKFKLFAVPLKL